MTVTELASRVSLSVSRTQRRLRDLENANVIRGYHADVDYSALGFGFEAIASSPSVTSPASMTSTRP